MEADQSVPHLDRLMYRFKCYLQTLDFEPHIVTRWDFVFSPWEVTVSGYTLHAGKRMQFFAEQKENDSKRALTV